MNDETAWNGHETAPIKTKSELLHAEITRVIIECFFAVYNKLGFGFLENVYCGALMLELKRRGHKVADLEVGLLLHFGPNPKFYRIAAPNDHC